MGNIEISISVKNKSKEKNEKIIKASLLQTAAQKITMSKKQYIYCIYYDAYGKKQLYNMTNLKISIYTDIFCHNLVILCFFFPLIYSS